MHLELALPGIRNNVAGLQGGQAKVAIIDYASLSLSDFKAALPDLRSAVAIARKQQVKVSLTVVTDLQQKFLASADASKYLACCV